MTLNSAMEHLRSCDGVFGWELDEERGSLFNSVPGKKIHWIFRHDAGHKKQVRSDHILLSCSESCKEDFGEIGNRELFVVSSHVDLNHCKITMDRTEIRKRWNCENKLVVGFLGRLDQNKNIIAISRAVAGRTDMTAICYGVKGWNTSELEQKIKETAGGNLQWYDALTEVGDILNGFDVLVAPSYSEVFSLSILEAWWTRTPVVCTSVGEVPELQRKFGKLCTLITPDASGSEIREAIHNAIEDKVSIERAYQMVNEHFVPHIVARQWNEFLNKVFS